MNLALDKSELAKLPITSGSREVYARIGINEEASRRVVNPEDGSVVQIRQRRNAVQPSPRQSSNHANAQAPRFFKKAGG